MKELLRFAAGLGITVHAARLEPGVMGEWYEDEREVYFDLRMSPDEQVFTVAHELGHAHHGHRCEDNQDAEDQADAYAAQLLINPERYAELEQQGLHQHDIAEELGVSVDALNLWMQACLVRLRGVTYARPRLGAGQWLHRQEIAV
ncbi:MAG: ImmA/IrrE family metallo-endopeptidase [Microbacterium sp.]|uniref:ImmA/IrrE family metallo-endopeptidase n=1 Tax=Microbacterium sp. TaxID=51671 RepID=UPI001AC288F6|nr:ImmA/IrrE family metallo-endopeptidase [Microbacterium sp.]MBN9176072.1 ImmA/IrrE family metallo-endopeptidase [Microbacterium sp.]